MRIRKKKRLTWLTDAQKKQFNKITRKMKKVRVETKAFIYSLEPDIQRKTFREVIRRTSDYYKKKNISDFVNDMMALASVKTPLIGRKLLTKRRRTKNEKNLL